jgi:type II restriction enzyme
LKGGIDPAGADEHWKTAGSALLRIKRAFQAEGLAPATFFDSDGKVGVWVIR